MGKNYYNKNTNDEFAKDMEAPVEEVAAEETPAAEAIPVVEEKKPVEAKAEPKKAEKKAKEFTKNIAGPVRN